MFAVMLTVADYFPVSIVKLYLAKESYARLRSEILLPTYYGHAFLKIIVNVHRY